MNDAEKSFTRSIDTITIEIACYNGRDYVEISRANLRGMPEPVMFPVGDEPAAYGFLSQVAELLGVKIVSPEKP